MELTNQQFANEIENYKFESLYGKPIPENEERAINIFNLLETCRIESNEQAWTKDELESHKVDLWMTAEEYERYLLKQRTGDDIIKDRIINKYQRRENEIKDKAAFQIQALEVSNVK